MKGEKWTVTDSGLGVRTESGVPVCTTWIRNPNRKRDAHVIAAAPDLFEACEKTLNALRNCRLPREQPGETELILEAALTKARRGGWSTKD